MQTRGKTLPFHLLQLIIYPAYDPHIPIPGTYGGRFPIGKKIEGTNPHAPVVLIVERYTNAVDHIGILIIGGKLPFCHHGIPPLGSPPLG